MRQTFEFCAPTRVRFGVGEIAQLGGVLGAGPWGMLSSPSVVAQPQVAGAVAACRSEGLSIELLGHVTPNPKISEIDAALDAAVQSAVTGVLAVGGGSVMDAAKVLSVAYRYRASAGAVLDDLPAVLDRGEQRHCRLVVVPTTAGTGAEVSRGAIVTDEEKRRKLGVRGPALVPDDALIDPSLALSLSPRRTAETGFDVIAHAVETYLSLAATPVTDVFALAALEVVPAALVRAVADGTNLGARTILALHSWLMGYNLAHASTCLPHRLQYPVGALTDSGHQIGLAAVYPAWLQRVAAVAATRLHPITSRIRASLTEAGVAVPEGDDASALFSTMFQRLGIGVRLTDLGVAGGDLSWLVDSVSGRLDLDPLKPARQDIERIFAESL